MGTFNWPIRVARLDGEQARDIEATVNTGATYTVLPFRLLRELGITATRQAPFELDDGRIVQMDIGEVRVAVNGESAVTPVAFGEDDAQIRLGSLTLTGLLLAVDSDDQKLVPTNAIWYRAPKLLTRQE